MKINDTPSGNSVTISYRVPYADTDQMKVVYYANYFIYFERLRNELIRETGMPYTQVENELGLMFPVIEAHCNYNQSAKYDDLIDICGWLEWIHGGRFCIAYRICTQDKTLVTGYTIHGVINMEGRVRRVPPLLTELWKKHGARPKPDDV